MMNYAPDGLAGGGAALYGIDRIGVTSADALPEEGVLLRWLAVARDACAAPQAGFEPEKMSGFCAAG